MRIITGSARGTRLNTLSGEETRPTAERVKEAMFSAIQFNIEGRRVLDLFGGSGQLALEALSRGADSAVAVDSNRKAADIIRANSIKTNMLDRCKTVCADWRDYLKTASGKEAFSLVFLDPPYKDGFLDEVIKRLFAASVLAADVIIVCESGEGGIPVPPDGYTAKLYRYGKTYVTVLRSEAEADII